MLYHKGGRECRCGNAASAFSISFLPIRSSSRTERSVERDLCSREMKVERIFLLGNNREIFKSPKNKSSNYRKIRVCCCVLMTFNCFMRWGNYGFWRKIRDCMCEITPKQYITCVNLCDRLLSLKNCLPKIAFSKKFSSFIYGKHI